MSRCPGVMLPAGSVRHEYRWVLMIRNGPYRLCTPVEVRTLPAGYAVMFVTWGGNGSGGAVTAVDGSAVVSRKVTASRAVLSRILGRMRKRLAGRVRPSQLFEKV
ncbi:hypothetical protein GCM10022235_02530 [Kribbella ginsengisoli]|uniref:Uncharacterized protein n=1 Tax=Kribbella ginsengisoli TaxID=363865 RepID=A0ABP6VMZ8_9ACTN